MSLARNIATVGGLTFVSRLLGFARDVGIAAVFGAGIRADAFFVAFQFASLLRRLLAEGSLNAAAVPLYLRARDAGGEQAAAAFAGRLLGTSAVGLTGLAVLLALAMPLLVALLAPGFGVEDPRAAFAIELSRLMLPYLALAGPIAVLMAVLNANHRFGWAALAGSAFNVAMLIALVIIFIGRGGDSEWSGRVLAIGVALAGVVQLALLGGAVWAGRERVAPLRVSLGPDIRGFLALAAPGLVANGIPQITIIAATMVASLSPSAVSWIYYANRLIELPLGIVGIAIGTVLVPAFTHALRSGSHAELAAAESRGLELALGLTLPAALALVVLAQPVVSVLFERGAFTPADTAATSAALSAFALGLPGHVLVKTFSPIFFAREDTATPMYAALFGFAVALTGSMVMMPLWGPAGIALAVAASGWSTAAVLALLIAQRIGFSLDADARRRLPRIVLAAALMGLGLEAARRLLPPLVAGGHLARAVVLGLLVAGGLALYATLLRLLGVARLSDLMVALRRVA